MTADVTYALITRLKADTPVAAVVGTRIYRRTLPSSPTFPAITVTQIDDIADTDSTTGGWAHTRIQTTAWATSDGAAANLSELIRASLHRLINTMLTAGTDRVYVVQINDAGARPDENTDIPLYMMHRDFMVMYDYK